MMRAAWMLVGVLCLGVFGAGCASWPPMPKSFPVVVSVSMPDPELDDVQRHTSGTVVERRVLTAAHILGIDADGTTNIEEWIELHRVHTQVQSVHHGDLMRVARLQDPEEPISSFMQDWLAFETNWRIDGAPPVWEMGDGQFVDGEILFAVRSSAPRKLKPEAMPLRARRVEYANDEPISEGMLFAVPLQRHHAPGWSGSFVGRYDAESDRWTFVGMLVGHIVQTNRRKLYIVIRPPEEVIRWLLHGEASTGGGGGG